jgi:NADH dehydrogenase/NADH:ubiquinone oxidoreductase subunit G
MHNVKVIINDKIINTEPNKTILEVALENNIYIPNLCHHSDLKPVGACRLCLVAVEKIGLATACNTFVTDRMNIHTETNEIKSMRKTLLELLLVDHPHNCLECRKNSKCELQKVARYVGIGEENFTPTKRYEKFRDPISKLPISDKRDFLLYVRDTNGKYLTSGDYRVNKVYARIIIKNKKVVK